ACTDTCLQGGIVKNLHSPILRFIWIQRTRDRSAIILPLCRTYILGEIENSDQLRGRGGGNLYPERVAVPASDSKPSARRILELPITNVGTGYVWCGHGDAQVDSL